MIQEISEIPLPSVDGSSTSVLVYGLSLAGSIILAFVGKTIKDRMSAQRLEDASNNITVESLSSCRTRIAELEARIRELEGQARESLQETIASARSLILAERNASDAAAKAEYAAALAEDARRDADNARVLLDRQRAYIARLRQAMLEAGLTPPEPDAEL